jgi:hypothetical protein
MVSRRHLLLGSVVAPALASAQPPKPEVASSQEAFKAAVSEVIVPVTTKDWLVILPYCLLVPLLLSRDALQRRMLRR